MTVKHWIVGCALTLPGAAFAAAPTVSAAVQNLSGVAHTVGDVALGTDGSAGDEAGRGSHAPDDGRSNHNDSSTSDDGLGGSSSRPTLHPHRLGWQSLLPGSIQ